MAATLTFAILALGGAALADAGEGAGYYGHHGGMGWGGWFLGPIMMLIFLGLIVAAVVFFIRLLGGGSQGGGASGKPGGDRSLDILRERFASGEIDAEEFETRKKLLG